MKGKKDDRDRIRRDDDGMPVLTKAQLQRVHRYAGDLIRTGTSRRAPVSPLLMACAVYDALVDCKRLAMIADANQARASMLVMQVQASLSEKALVASVGDVAKLAIALINGCSRLPDDQARHAYLRDLASNTSTFMVGADIGPVEQAYGIPVGKPH